MSVADGDSDTVYEGSFIIHSGADEGGKLHMEHGQTATISADLDADGNGVTKQITADYGITPLTDMIWTYRDSSRTMEATEFGDGDTVYLKVTDTETKGGAKVITVKNNQIGNTISVNVTDSNGDSFYLGSFIVYSGANDDANDKLALFSGQSATITADLAADGASGTKTITAAYLTSTVSQIYIKYQGTLLYNLASSTNRHNPTVFAKGKIDEIYFKVNLLAGAPLNESSSSIALYKLVDGETEEVSGSQEMNQDTGWAELVFYLAPVFDPDVDKHSRDGLYWVDVTVVDTAGNSEDFDFYFIYDTISPSTPDFQITSYDPTAGSITVSGTTVPDELSDPQQVEIFVNESSKATVTTDSNYQFVKGGIGLARGINYIAVQSMDKAGNKSKLSESLKLEHNPEGLLSIVIRSTHVVRRNSSIEIIYSVTQPAEITIRIYNLNGKLVKNWNGDASPGVENEWKWYGKNMYEEKVNNGVYIFKISAKSSRSRERKIKLLAVLR